MKDAYNISSRCTTLEFLTGIYRDSEKEIACLERFFKSRFFTGFFSFRRLQVLNRAGKTKEKPILRPIPGVITPTPVSALVVINFSSFFRLYAVAGQVHYLVGLFEPYGVNLSKSHKLG